MKHPHEGGRYYREKNEALTRADKDGKHPLGDKHVEEIAKANAAAAKTETKAAPAADTVKGKSDA